MCLDHAFVYVLVLQNRGNWERALALRKYFLRGKQQENAEDEFAGTVAQER